MKATTKLLLLLFTVASLHASAQQQRIIAMSISITTNPADTTQFGVPIINDSATVFSAFMNVNTNSLDSI